MATDAIYPIAQEATRTRSNRFTDRLNACKGALDRQNQPNVRMQPVFATVPKLTALPEREAGNHPAGEEEQSFLQLYMKAFAAARR